MPALYKPEPTKEELQKDKMNRYEYATYIMLGSYFKKSKITIAPVETRWKINYSEVNPNKQCDLEEIVIDMVDNHLLPKLSKIKNMEEKEVFCQPKTKADGTHYLRFYGDDFDFMLNLKAVFKPEKGREVLYANFEYKIIDGVNYSVDKDNNVKKDTDKTKKPVKKNTKNTKNKKS